LERVQTKASLEAQSLEAQSVLEVLRYCLQEEFHLGRLVAECHLLAGHLLAGHRSVGHLSAEHPQEAASHQRVVGFHRWADRRAVGLRGVQLAVPFRLQVVGFHLVPGWRDQVQGELGRQEEGERMVECVPDRLLK